MASRIQSQFEAEVDSLVRLYEQFERLLPNERVAGSAHSGEDGRFVEALLRKFLRSHLPRRLEVVSGFVLRAGVKTRRDGRARAEDDDAHSGQIDILVVDTHDNPLYERFEDSVIVPPEAVVAALSVKKRLRARDLEDEIEALANVGNLCATKVGGQQLPGPFLALVSMSSEVTRNPRATPDWVGRHIQAVLSSRSPAIVQHFPNFVGCVDQWTVFRKVKSDKRVAEYRAFWHERSARSVGLQLLLHGILKSMFGRSLGNADAQPGFVDLPAKNAVLVGTVPFATEWAPYQADDLVGQRKQLARRLLGLLRRRLVSLGSEGG